MNGVTIKTKMPNLHDKLLFSRVIMQNFIHIDSTNKLLLQINILPSPPDGTKILSGPYIIYTIHLEQADRELDRWSRNVGNLEVRGEGLDLETSFVMSPTSVRMAAWA